MLSLKRSKKRKDQNRAASPSHYLPIGKRSVNQNMSTAGGKKQYSKKNRSSERSGINKCSIDKLRNNPRGPVFKSSALRIKS